MAIDADQSWNGGFTLPCMGPWMTPSPKASQKFQNTRSFWNSVNLRGQGNRLWQKGQQKSTSWTGCGYGTQTYSTQFAVWKRFWNLSLKRFNSSISFRSSPSHRTQLRLRKPAVCCNPWDPWLIQVTRGPWSPLEWSSRLQRSKTSKRLRPWSSASGDVTKHDQWPCAGEI